LASTRSRATTQDFVEVLAVDVAEAFPGPRRADGDGIEGLLVPRVEDRAVLEDPAADMKRQRLEDRHVEIRLRHVLEPLLRPVAIGARFPREHETDVEVRAGGSVSAGAAPEEEHREHVGIRLGVGDEAGEGRGRHWRPCAHDTWTAAGWSNHAQRLAPSVGGLRGEDDLTAIEQGLERPGALASEALLDLLDPGLERSHVLLQLCEVAWYSCSRRSNR
jgi:hypothetical protein